MENSAVAAWGAEPDAATPPPATAESDTPAPAHTPSATLDAATVRELADRIGGCVEAAVECLEVVLESNADIVDRDSAQRAIDALRLAGNQRFIFGGGN